MKPSPQTVCFNVQLQQLLTKKNGMSIDTKTRDMRTGLLSGHDKNGRSSDRENESFAISGLDNALKEFTRPRAAAMGDKSIMNSTIKTMGQVRLSDLPDDPSDDLSKNLLSAYFIGAGIVSNITNLENGYLTPYAAKRKKMRVERI